MSAFVVEPAFWELFPDCEIGVLVIDHIDNTELGNARARPAIDAELERANELARRHLGAPVVSQNPVVAVWRDAFGKVGTKKGARASIEALLPRVEKGRGVGPISPLVDIYNAISLESGFPCGVEDIDTFVGDLRLTIASGGDTFRALGDEEESSTLDGEDCYLDDAGAVCRCWNWRDGERTMLTDRTTRAVAIIESIDASRHDDVLAALDALAERDERHLAATISRRSIVTVDTPTVSLDPGVPVARSATRSAT